MLPEDCKHMGTCLTGTIGVSTFGYQMAGTLGTSGAGAMVTVRMPTFHTRSKVWAGMLTETWTNV